MAAEGKRVLVPGVRSDLAANVPVAFNEMNRFCGPAQWFGRTARERVTVADQMVEPGQRVIYLLQSAARDEREFPEPDEFRWNRTIRRELAFGHGLKFCIGAHLARLEGRVLLEEFLGPGRDHRRGLDRRDERHLRKPEPARQARGPPGLQIP